MKKWLVGAEREQHTLQHKASCQACVFCNIAETQLLVNKANSL